MPIEIKCPSCQKKLRVPETAVGKRAKCPGCEQVIVVPGAAPPKQPAPAPATSSAPPAPAGGMPPALNPFGGNADTGQVPLGSNPYAAPNVAKPATSRLNSGTGKLEASRAVGVAWTLFKENMGVLIGAFVVITAVNQLFSFAQQMVQLAVLQGGGPPGPNGPSGAQLTILFSVIIGFFIIGQMAQTFLWAGLVNMQLHIVRGQQAGFGMLFSGGRWFLKVFLGNLLFGLMILIGFAALVVPGIYLGLRYWSFSHFIVDQDCSITESFRLAGEASKGNLGETFLLGLIGMGLSILGLIMLCIGLLFTAPVFYLSITIAYMMMTGQPFRQGPRGV